MSLYARLAPKGSTAFGYGSTAMEATEGVPLSDQTVLVTGVNSGLGRHTAEVLLRRGAQVLGTVREPGRAGDLAREGACTELACDLGDPNSVLGCVQAIMARGLRLDALIANAGIMALPMREEVHGCERQLFVNHVGHFLLVTRLLDQLSHRARVVVLTSDAHRLAPTSAIRLREPGPYAPMRAYAISKLANVLFAKALARRFAGTSRTANAVHPGIIKTNLGRSVASRWMHAAFAVLDPVFLKDVARGAATQCLVAVHPVASGINGAYWSSCNVAKSRADTDDVALAEQLWDDTEALLANL